MQSIFSERSFASLMRAGDAFQFDIDLKKDRDKIIEHASKAALSGSIDLTKFNSSIVNNKPCITYGDYDTHLLLRSLTRHLRKRGRIRTYGRDQIVRGVIETLLDATPMHCIRRDITSFYETLPIEPIRDRLIYDTQSSTLARHYIKQFFDTHCASTQNIGLPRGVGLSALLAEMAMREFDQSVRSQAGVFKYYRFSDDIMAFTTAHPDTLEQFMTNSLPGNMRFNLSKSKTYELAKSGGPGSGDVEYLGYLFRSSNPARRADSREVDVAIASKKIKRLKTRIILSLKAMSKTKDGALLEDRIRFLSSNYRVKRQGNDVVRHGTHVYSGIFYNYKMCGNYAVRKDVMIETHYDGAELKALDGFYHSLLKVHSAGKRPLIPSTRLARLKRYSFHKGYAMRLRARFEDKRIGEIKKAWRNA